MSPYTSITIIYNPKSTGPGKKIAAEFQKKLQARLSDQIIDLVPTEHAGHAEILAEALALASPRPLIIAASGDGGYHEIINGALKAQATSAAQPTTALLPAGNANDHHHSLHYGNLVQRVVTGEAQIIDVLELSSTVNTEPYHRFAHSYIGAGLSSVVGKELNNASLNRYRETAIVLKAFFTLKPVHLKIAGKTNYYDTVICSNVPRMAKILSLSKKSSVDDGLFEVTALQQKSFISLFRYFLRAATLGLAGQRQVRSFSFQTLDKSVVLQLDGELVTVDAHSKVTIKLAKKSLSCIV